MQDISTSSLKKKRAALLRNLPDLQKLIRGSLIERYKRCGKSGCKCATGQGHGPKHYLSTHQPGGTPLMEYVPQSYEEQIKEYLENFRQAREILDEICQINQELLRRREIL
jgi:hypothetical protein